MHSLTDLPEFLTITETAKLLRCHDDTVSAMARRGDIKVIKIGRCKRIVRSSIYDYVNRGSDDAAAGKEADANV